MDFFVGVTPGPEYTERIQRLRRRFRGLIARLPEPHITVKAPGALTHDMRWLERMRLACSGFGPFEVTLGGLGFFGRTVLYIAVSSPPIYRLHQRLLAAARPSLELIARHYEGPDYLPHLTLGIVRGEDNAHVLDKMAAEAQVELAPYPTFRVESVRVYRRIDRYSQFERIDEISLRG